MSNPTWAGSLCRYPNVYEIKSLFGDRYLQQYLSLGDTVVLLDAGIIDTPEAAIFPYIQKIGLPPQQLTMVIAMHADSDHHGGLPAIKDASSSTLLACHEGDRALIEDPELLYRDRYNFLAKNHDLGFGREGMVWNWPQDAGLFLQFAIYGHLERLRQKGMVRSGTSVPIEHFLV